MHAEWRDGHKDIGLLPVDHAQSAAFAASDQRNMPTTPAFFNSGNARHVKVRQAQDSPICNFFNVDCSEFSRRN